MCFCVSEVREGLRYNFASIRNKIEEAKIYKKLIESLGKGIGRTHVYISERISLLRLPENIVTRDIDKDITCSRFELS